MSSKGYLCPAQASESEYTEKRSVFLGHLRPVETEEEAKEFIEAVKKKYADARHNVWAYSLPDGVRRASDDGEPSGTGGAPVLDAMVKRGITACAIVVTRYFGGILLGTGGLVRAYGGSASQLLDLAGSRRVSLYECCSLVCSYQQIGGVTRLCEKYACKDFRAEYAENVCVSVLIDPDLLSSFEADLREKTLGSVILKRNGSRAVRL